MVALQEKKDRLLLAITLFPLDAELKQKLVQALQEDPSEEVVDKVVGILKSQVESLRKVADLIESQGELDVLALEARLDELEMQIDEEEQQQS